jgi:hypothetical protein
MKKPSMLIINGQEFEPEITEGFRYGVELIGDNKLHIYRLYLEQRYKDTYYFDQENNKFKLINSDLFDGVLS